MNVNRYKSIGTLFFIISLGISVQFDNNLLQVQRMIKFNLDPESARLAYILSARDLNLLGHILIGIYATCTHRC